MLSKYFTEFEIIQGASVEEDTFILKDDFETIREQYFQDLIEKKVWYALPGGVQDNFSPYYESIPNITVPQKEMSGYKIDTGSNLNHLKKKMLPLLRMWEGRSYSIDEFSICPSVTFALNTLTMALKHLGVEMVVHETPAYFATVEQSKSHRLRTLLISTSKHNKFCMSSQDIDLINSQSTRYALVLTQPKIGTGLNREKGNILQIINNLPSESFLILDEAADRSFPILFPEVICGFSNVFRVKGIFKGIGLNGVKGAIIFHDRRYRNLISSIIEITGGTIDAFSTQTITKIAENTSFFKYALVNASDYIQKGVKILQEQLIGSQAQFNAFENGYIGLIKMPLPRGNFIDSRIKLLKEAQKLRSPLVLGSSMYFPYTRNNEWIRFNFYSTFGNIEKSAKVINQLSTIFNN